MCCTTPAAPLPHQGHPVQPHRSSHWQLQLNTVTNMLTLAVCSCRTSAAMALRLCATYAINGMTTAQLQPILSDCNVQGSLLITTEQNRTEQNRAALTPKHPHSFSPGWGPALLDCHAVSTRAPVHMETAYEDKPALQTSLGYQSLMLCHNRNSYVPCAANASAVARLIL